MAVIKCSNCENEILDTEIVCPYCDCPISETIKKMKKDDLENYSSTSIDSLTGKIPSVINNEEPKIATSADFAREKAAILRDLGIKVPGEDDEKASEANNIAEDKVDSPTEKLAPIKKVTEESPDDKSKTAPIAEKEPIKEGSKEEPLKEAVPQAETAMGSTVKISRDGKIEKDVLKKESVRTDSKPVRPKNETEKRKSASSGKTKKKKSKGKYAVLAVTIIGIIVVIYLIMGIADTISVGINKTKKINKTVTVVDSSASSDAEKGFEVHSSTLTITDDAVMEDYDSPQDTPWYEYRDKIKHVTFGKKVTRIGAHSFEGFENITDINISNSVKTIGESAFCNCVSLTKITNMSKNLEEISDYAFTGCKNLSKIPGYTEEANFEPSVKRIGVEAFKSCKSIEAFKVPESTEIDTDAFFGHGDEFVLICDTTSDAYVYATEKGIPTKVSFDEEVSDPETPAATIVTTPSATTPSTSSQTKKTETKKDNTESSEKSDKDTKKEETKDKDTVSETNKNDDPTDAPVANTPQTTIPPVSVPSGTYPSTGTPSVPPAAGIAPSATSPGGVIPQGGVVPPASTVPQNGYSGNAGSSYSTADPGKLTENFNNAQSTTEKNKALNDIANSLQ